MESEDFYSCTAGGLNDSGTWVNIRGLYRTVVTVFHFKVEFVVWKRKVLAGKEGLDCCSKRGYTGSGPLVKER